MRRQKSFDCVEMKWAIQRKLAEELPGLPEEEKRRVQLDRVRHNPILGPFIEQVEKSQSQSSTAQ